MKIKDFGKVVTGKTPPTSDNNNYGDGYKFISPADLHCNWFVKDSEKHITEKGLSSIKSSIIQDLSILVGCIGWDMGNVALVDDKCATNQQINAITNICKDVNPYYVYYWLKGKKNYLFTIANVTRTPILNKNDFENIDIPLPSKHYQDKVALLLSLLDKKIDNNLEIINYLEGITQLIYDYWFLQYDFPNENGKPYKSSGGKMIWNNKLNREIPEGWDVKHIIEVADLYQPKTISEKELIANGKYLVYGANGIVGRYDRYNHKENEVAICCRGASCGQYVMTQPYSWITGNAMVISPCTNDISREFLYYGLSIPLISKFITGSAQPQITRSNLELMSIVIPTNDVLKKFDSIANSIRTKLQNLFEENQQLVSLRDFLLPLLMNGQVKIKE